MLSTRPRNEGQRMHRESSENSSSSFRPDWEVNIYDFCTYSTGQMLHGSLYLNWRGVQEMSSHVPGRETVVGFGWTHCIFSVPSGGMTALI